MFTKVTMPLCLLRLCFLRLCFGPLCFILCVSLGVSFSGCSLLGAADLATASQAEREKTLHERLTKFHRELYWAGGSKFLEFIEASKRLEMGRQLRQAQELERFVDFEVQGVEFSPTDPDVADVDVKVRVYKKSSLTVSERFEKETWEYFRLRGGWFLRDREISPTAPLG